MLRRTLSTTLRKVCLLPVGVALLAGGIPATARADVVCAGTPIVGLIFQPVVGFESSTTITDWVYSPNHYCPITGTLSVTFNGLPVGPAKSITYSGEGANFDVLVDGSLVPDGAGTYVVTATFTTSDPNYTAASNTQNIQVRQKYGTVSYAGDLYVSDYVPPALAATVAQGAAYPGVVLLDYSAFPVWVRFDVTSPTASFVAFGQLENAGDWATTGLGSAAATLPALPDGAYAVAATLVDGPGSSAASRYLSGYESRIGFVSSPIRKGFVSGSGAIGSDPSWEVLFPYTYFAVQMKPGSTVEGDLVYIYRAIVVVGPGSAGETDIVITSTDVTSLRAKNTQVLATGHFSVTYVDAWTGQIYANLGFSGGTFRLSVDDGAKKGTADGFALALMNPDGTLFHASATLDTEGNVPLAPLVLGDIVNNL